MSAFKYRLLEVHQKLQAEIESERRMRVPDPFRLQRLKKLKLAIKDRLNQVRAPA